MMWKRYKELIFGNQRVLVVLQMCDQGLLGVRYSMLEPLGPIDGPESALPSWVTRSLIYAH